MLGGTESPEMKRGREPVLWIYQQRLESPRGPRDHLQGQPEDAGAVLNR